MIKDNFTERKVIKKGYPENPNPITIDDILASRTEQELQFIMPKQDK